MKTLATFAVLALLAACNGAPGTASLLLTVDGLD
jgi:hypothetical protein